MFDVHLKSGSPNVAQWFVEPFHSTDSYQRAVAVARDALNEENVLDAVVIEWDGGAPSAIDAYTEVRCALPSPVRDALELDD